MRDFYSPTARREFELGDRVQINAGVHVGKKMVGGRLCTVRGVHKGQVVTGLSLTNSNLSLTDSSDVHMVVPQEDVTFIRHGDIAVRIGDAVHAGTELVWTLLFWAALVFLPALFGMLGAHVGHDMLTDSTVPAMWHLTISIAVGVFVALCTVGGILAAAVLLDTPQAGDRNE